MYTFNRNLSQYRRPLPQPIPPAGFAQVLTPATNRTINPAWSAPAGALPPVSAMSGFRRRGLGDGLSFDGQGLLGTGLFEGGFDFQNWTIWEWGISAGAVLLLVKAMGGMKGFHLGSSKAAKRKKLKIMRDELALAEDS